MAAADATLAARGLTVELATRDGRFRPVDGVDLDIARGEMVGLVGESGSGKSLTALSLLRMQPPGAVLSGEVRFQGEDIVTATESRLRELRGAKVAMIFQDPLTSLNPTLTVGRQLTEAMLIHGRLRPAAARRRAIELLELVGVRDAERRIDSYPYQFSGGMRQRVMIAMAISNEPALLIADEPTTALDVTIQAQILELLRRLNRELHLSLLLISHNLAVVAGLCHRTYVMYGGRIVEEGETRSLLLAPRHPYTSALIRALPSLEHPREALASIPGAPPDPLHLPPGCRFHPRCAQAVGRCSVEAPRLLPVDGRRAACWVTQADPSALSAVAVEASKGLSMRPAVAADLGPPLLEAVGLTKVFRRRGWLQPVHEVRAVDGVDIRVGARETLGIVGESGSGKSTLARLLMHVSRATSGRILFEGEDVTDASGDRLRRLRRQSQMVFQDPYSSLDPRLSVRRAIAEPLEIHGFPRGRERADRIASLLEMVGLSSRLADRLPRDLSGGQRQRVAIARALALFPRLLVCDEAVASLDASIQAQVINLLKDLQVSLGLSYVFIGHDLAVVRHVSDRIAVMHQGRIVETGPAATVVAAPAHAYTRALIDAVPTLDGAPAASFA